MTPEEQAFQAAMDVRPTDWTAYLVFADWLQDRDDPRADGYRALAAMRLEVLDGDAESGFGFTWYNRGHAYSSVFGREAELPGLWFMMLEGEKRGGNWYVDFDTNAKARDEAALAWSRGLTPLQQELILAKYTVVEI